MVIRTMLVAVTAALSVLALSSARADPGVRPATTTPALVAPATPGR